MKILITGLFFCISFNCFAQKNKNEQASYIFKFGPFTNLSVDSKLCFGVERRFKKLENNSIQLNAGYVYNWGTLPLHQIYNKYMNGFELGTEYRYKYADNNFIGVGISDKFLAYKAAIFIDNQIGFLTLQEQNFKKNKVNLYFIYGRQMTLYKRLKAESFFKIGASSKQYYNNGFAVESIDYLHDGFLEVETRSRKMFYFSFDIWLYLGEKE